jgi:hypothetical protein
MPPIAHELQFIAIKTIAGIRKQMNQNNDARGSRHRPETNARRKIACAGSLLDFGFSHA